jgi:hypothetical protein
LTVSEKKRELIITDDFSDFYYGFNAVDLIGTNALYDGFLSALTSEFDSPFDKEYNEIEIWNYGIADTGDTVAKEMYFNSSFICSTVSEVDPFVQYIRSRLYDSGNLTVQPDNAFNTLSSPPGMTCTDSVTDEAVEWQWAQNSEEPLLITANVSSDCRRGSSTSATVPSDSRCLPDGEVVKIAGYLRLSSTLRPISTVPKNLVLTVNSTSSSTLTIDINVTVSSPGATIYCAAVDRDATTVVDGTTIKLADEFIINLATSNEFDVTYVQYTFPQSPSTLVASTDYDVYCYGEDSFGNGMESVDILATKVQASTDCCRDVLFTNVPRSLYTDPITKYLSSRAADNLYNFIFKLDAIPDSDLTVTPVLKDSGGVEVTSVSILPASFTFNSGQKLVEMSSRFVLFGDAAFSGDCTIELELSGTDSSIYTVPLAVSIALMSTSQPSEAPILKEVLFSDAGLGLLLNLLVHLILLKLSLLLGFVMIILHSPTQTKHLVHGYPQVL